jgi:site-specific DNA recombinase
MTAIYSRKSKYTGIGESTENQIQLCREYAIKHLNATENNISIYEDEGFSGGNTKRPEFQRLLNDIKTKKISTLICYRLDRISRNVADFSSILEMLTESKVEFVSIRESFDTSTPMGKAMIYICSVFAQLERETIAERIRDNMYELAKTGRWLGGATPLGFESKQINFIDEDGKSKKYNVLSSKPTEKKTVQILYKEFIKLGSLSKLQTFAYTHNLKTRNNTDFHINCLRTLLANPVYCKADEIVYDYLTNKGIEIFAPKVKFDGKNGLTCYNKTSKDSKKITHPKGYSEWIISVGQHEGIIDSEDWINAQKILDINKNKAIRRARNPMALLSGLLFCKNCGAHLRPKYSNHGITKDEDRIYYYICEMKEKSKKTRCNVDNVNGNYLDKIFLEHLHQMSLNNFDFCGEFKITDIKNSEDETDVLLSKLNNSLQETSTSISALVDNLSQGSYEKAVVDVIMAQIGELTNKKQSIEKEIEGLTEKQNDGAEVVKSIETMQNTLFTVNSAFDSLSVFERRNKLKIIINKILWDGEGIDVLLHGA